MIAQLLKDSLPTYEVYLPLSKKKCKFRPMTVKEEKILLLAQQSQSIKEMGNALVKILKNCFHDLPDVESLPIADAEKAFLAIRSKSIGEETTFYVKCPETQKNITLRVNLEDISVEIKDKIENKIKLSDDMILIVKYPTLKYLCEDEEEDEQRKQFRSCFVELQTKENTIKKEELTDENLNEFYENMTTVQQNKFFEYTQSMPRARKKISYIGGDGVQREMEVYGIDSFFAFASAT